MVMTTLKFIFLGLFCLGITACTSEEGLLKKQATAIGEAKLQEAVRLEADEMLKGSALLHEGYLQYMRQHAEVVVEEVQMLEGNVAVVTVTMKAPSLKMRRTLMEIAAKVEASKSRRFNFPEAVKRISQQTGENPEGIIQPLGVYRFRKVGDKWVTE